MTDDATSRAREVIRETYGEDGWPVGAITADNIARALAEYHFAIYDTRTHAAVPREPSDEVVERLFCLFAWGSPEVPSDLAPSELTDAMRGNPALVSKCRAAIAALVQTQGGEPDAPNHPPI